MFQPGGTILAALTVGNVFTVLYCIFLCPQGHEKKKLFSCEGWFQPTHFLYVPCKRRSFVYGLIIYGVCPEARKNLTVIINSAGRSSLLNHLSAWSLLTDEERSHPGNVG